MIDDKVAGSQWTPRRVVRMVGTTTLVIALLMALFGSYSINFRSSARLFFFYWSVFAVTLMTAITCAVLDAFATIIRFRHEHRELRRTFRRTADDEDGREA